MTFDFLPNEIFIECFEYLNVFDIFHSFDQLNSRFHTLIRSIPLHLNLHHINQSFFDQFCQQILLNPQIKNQIISLKLSNKNTYGQLNVFLSFFSFKEFPQLRSLTLIDLDSNNIEQIKSVLLILSDFFNDYSNVSITLPYDILSKLLPSRIQMTSILNSLVLHQTITSLTIDQCILDDLYQLFQYASMLKYLSIRKFRNSSLINNNSDHTFYLKELIIHNSNANFQIYELLLKQTPNLKKLTITVEDALDIIDAGRWQHLIQSSLHKLDIFNFRFFLWINTDYHNILNMLEQFQSDFWHQQHQWYTNYELNSLTAYIYTIPYVWNYYKLHPNRKTFGISSINNLNIFNNVTDLLLFIEILDDQSKYYFRHVKSLILTNEQDPFFDKFLWYNRHSEKNNRRLKSIRTIVNLSNLEHLDIKSICNHISSNTLLNILKQTPKLSSLVMTKSKLMSFLTNDKLCFYLNKMIKILDITHYDHDFLINMSQFSEDKFIESYQSKEFCQIFANVEQLQCCIKDTDVVLFILDHLPKLKKIQVKNFSCVFSQHIPSPVKMAASKRNINCIFLPNY
jgi:hypothetical protein